MSNSTAGLQHLHDIGNLVGEAPRFVKAVAQLPAIASSEATVLIAGETGTGKELIARAVHYLGKRSMYPFVAVSCACFQPTLVEDELFGHERGAFTDAHARRVGLIAHAERGTLFLDEVDALSPSAQAALLRVMQDKRYRPVGSNTERQADVRIVAATNARLDPALQTGQFRADLYYRLCVFVVNLPPLRERREDILSLAEHFLRKHAASDAPIPLLSARARDALLAYDWPGNVRELENVIERAVVLAVHDVLSADDLPAEVRGTPQPAPEPARGELLPLEEVERVHVLRVLEAVGGNREEAARILGISRRTLSRMAQRWTLPDARTRG